MATQTLPFLRRPMVRVSLFGYALKTLLVGAAWLVAPEWTEAAFASLWALVGSAIR